MGIKAHLPEWMFRRRRRSFGEQGFQLPTKEEVADREACRGADPLEAAVNWMRHVCKRDFEFQEIERAIVVVEVGSGRRAQTVYTTHRTDATPVEIRGLLSEAMRGQAEIIARHNRSRDIDHFARVLAPQLGDLISERAGEIERVVLEQQEDIEMSGRDRLREELSADDLTPGAIRRLAAHVPESDARRDLCDFANRLESTLKKEERDAA